MAWRGSRRPAPSRQAAWLGDIDMYLFDQLLKGRFRAGMRILDAGCGAGRNLIYFLRAGFDVCAADEDDDALDHVREMAAELAPGLPRENFRAERLEAMSFAPGSFDAVICNAVLHYARDEEHFLAMLGGLWEVLAPGGLLLARLASTIGLESHVKRLPGGKYRMPGGAEWFLAGEAKLILAAEMLGGELAEPLKTVNVRNLRCMTTWILRKPRERSRSSA